MIQSQDLSAAFPYKSQFATIDDVKLHYIDEGQGQPMVFIHGVPTSSYLWRNVIPLLQESVRTIALDLVGFGKSDKPNIAYTVFEHIDYFERFIETLKLKNIVLVLHGWGSVIGFEYFRRHPENVAGIVFMEAYFRPPKGWDMLSLPVQELASIMASPDGGYDVIMNSHYFLNKVLPSGVMRRLTDEEMAYYTEPFLQPGSAKPIWQYLQEIPLGDGPELVMQLMEGYSAALQASDVPMLMLYAIPGYITTIASIEWATQHFKNLQVVEIGEGLHYLQETDPAVIGHDIKQWYDDEIVSSSK
jgi:haloalkane dehalogenase